MVTWRPAVLVALGALSIPLWPLPWLGVAAVLLLAATVTAIDYALAAPVATGVKLRRVGTRTVRLGESATVSLTITNVSGRHLVGDVRDAWAPSAGAVRYSHPLNLPSGASITIDTHLTPTRRGDRHAERVTLRAYGPLRFAFRQLNHRMAQQLTPAWTLRVLPRFESRALVPEKLARLRVIEGSVAIRGRGQG